ncbi:hypothetical protein AGLY_016874 [Aphis glycines]|uniref:Transposable element P transposase-like RNase H C-terminal domain-containing protein n=1 Tax=Aphis glycines TaxID=307491 RepID=A0A6G0SYJ2_APHGL|nr:hypothetical protein AGLY_016874 [Aphis glycines]
MQGLGKEFIDFLITWQICTNKQNQFTIQTQTGLLISLKGALELAEYLCYKVGYSYLMTRRINQDALEHLFGNLRQGCGANQHPDPLQFKQIYRLLSCYSLIKPPKGSNISGGKIHFDALLDHSYTKQNSSKNDSIDLSALTYFIGLLRASIRFNFLTSLVKVTPERDSDASISN